MLGSKLRIGGKVSWCDKLASTPTVGLRFAPNHRSSDSILDALSPLFDSWVVNWKQQFTIEKLEAFGIQFITKDGFNYSINQERVTVEFKHRWEVKQRSGGVPITEMISKRLPYTQLLEEVSDLVLDAANLINGPRPRLLDRIGIVSSTTVGIRDAPPGIIRLIEFMRKPWRSDLPHFNIQITGELGKTPDYSDRCIHVLAKGEEPETSELLTVKLDWQRVFNMKPVTTDVVKRHVSSARKAALDYFEDVAEGRRFDEQYLNSAT